MERDFPRGARPRAHGERGAVKAPSDSLRHRRGETQTALPAAVSSGGDGPRGGPRNQRSSPKPSGTGPAAAATAARPATATRAGAHHIVLVLVVRRVRVVRAGELQRFGVLGVTRVVPRQVVAADVVVIVIVGVGRARRAGRDDARRGGRR